MLRSKKTASLFLLTTLIASLSIIFTFAGFDPSLKANLVFAQTLDSNAIQIIGTSSFIDDLGNFHVIGEVNNTAFDPQTDIVITTILSNTTNKTIVGNHSAFTSIGTLRHGESSPFDILVQDPQIVGKFNFIEFFTSSRPTTEKPANLIINDSSVFLDNVGNPHITGNIINQGPFPEQFLNLVATFYDNSSLGIVGTQSFGLNVANLSQNQVAPFDITITDNKTKSQGAFYSLYVKSDQSSMSLPFSSKSSFVSTGGSFSGANVLSNTSSSSSSVGLPSNDNSNNDLSNPRNDSDNDNQNNNDNDDQRGEKKTDDNGNPYYNDKNCSEKPGSSGGNSSECQDAENEEQSEQEDEDSSEKDQGPPSNSDSTGDNNGEDSDAGNESDDDKNTDSNEENGSGDDGGNN
ncbi:hypothetical protein NMY3_01010 [Candidatus Nitrosocosmicus oleophilus]|uniref:Uncharacterized protein n=1 Tax=Candidatus Nitrosocosmicus oleophilus TaxID=1353260 RepID=A0A654LVJ1_9ARCH|nr:hypothetical protein [Candidatus Nitrosocosmicus oleophilus]ALI35215.1 hypothetical protein NMY3_01010 [Candidatus Nitrosocosmicus oleophilus]